MPTNIPVDLPVVALHNGRAKSINGKNAVETAPSEDSVDFSFPVIRHTPQPTVADQVFDVLRQHILTLELPPQTKISEAEVSKKLGVSRQPVRDAFKRLAKLGLLDIRPQSSRRVSLISQDAVRRARFIRTTLEVKTCRTAGDTSTPKGLSGLGVSIDQQRSAIANNDRSGFLALDKQFHIRICIRAGVAYVWDLIQDSNAHMDRIRMLSLRTSSRERALAVHIEIYTATKNRQPGHAVNAMTRHLSRIILLVKDVKSQQHNFFLDTTA